MKLIITVAGSLIELLAACVIVYHVVWSLGAILRREGIYAARLSIAEGVLSALNFSVAGTLLKIIAIQTWPEIRAFTFIFLLRTLLKRIFSLEQRYVEARQSHAK